VVGVLAGLVGVVVPALPGLVLVLVAAAGTLLVQQGGPLTWTLVVVLVALTVAGSVSSAVLPARTAAASGVPRSTLVAGGVGAVVGFFVLPVLGLLLGGVGGLLVAEQRRLGEWAPAWDSARGVLRAYGLGVLLELAIGVVMAALWLVVFVTRAV
jgi:uncharacterized protein YqgC (DUF456 family)